MFLSDPIRSSSGPTGLSENFPDPLCVVRCFQGRFALTETLQFFHGIQGLFALLGAIGRIDRMDSKIYLFPCGRNPLSYLYHPSLVKLHTKQLEIWKIQRTQWRVEQQNLSPETGFLRFTQLWRLPQTHFAYLRQASSFSGSSLRFGKCQSRKENLSVMQCTTIFFRKKMIRNKNERIKADCRLMLTHFSSQITSHFSLIFEPITD